MRKKYDLKKVYEPVHFLRMRPGSFPGIRFSQLANFYSDRSTWFSWLLQCNSLGQLKKTFRYRPMITGIIIMFLINITLPGKITGIWYADNIIINAIIPLLYTYGRFIPDSGVLKKALNWLEEMPAEQNTSIRHWKQIGITVKKGSASQALLELKKQYCDRRKCLECDIGKYLLSPENNG